MEPNLLDVRRDGAVAYVTLTRPGRSQRAFNAALNRATSRSGTFAELDEDDGVRTIVLSGSGKVFSGGADINWMRASLELEQAARHRAL